MPSSHLILCHPLLLLPPIPPSIRVFSNESTLCMRWPKYWSYSLTSFLPKKSQGWSPSEWTGWISLQSKGLSRVFSNTTVQKHQFLIGNCNSCFLSYFAFHRYLLYYHCCCCCSVAQSFQTLWDLMDCSTPGFPVFHISWSLLKLMSIEWVMPSNHLILCRPLLLLPSIFPSIRVFSDESVLCIKRPKYWSFSFSFSPSNEYSWLISFRMDWWDLLAIQRTLRSFLQHHSLKTSIPRCSAFFMVQLSHL